MITGSIIQVSSGFCIAKGFFQNNQLYNGVQWLANEHGVYTTKQIMHRGNVLKTIENAHIIPIDVDREAKEIHQLLYRVCQPV